MSCCSGVEKKTECCGGRQPCQPEVKGSEKPAVADQIHQSVKSHYGGQKSCCAYKISDSSSKRQTEYVDEIISQLHPDVLEKYYGCGLAIPEFTEGAKVLDLGCGAGRDVFIMSKLVGAEGRVVGVDMTEEMLNVATKHAKFHADKFGFSNTSFLLGELEHLDQLGLEPNSFDVAISNCVINLVPSKETAFKQIFDVLKPGGEFYFSDVYCATAVPELAQKHSLAWNECLSGALPWAQFESLVKKIGFLGPFVCSSADYKPTHPDIVDLLSGLKFWSRTVRLIKPLKPVVLSYRGLIGGNYTARFNWDEKHSFGIGDPTEVEPDVAAAIMSSRYGQFFFEI